MPEKHRTLWEVMPHDRNGIPTLLRIHDEARPSQTHGVLTYLFEREEDARAFTVGHSKYWTIESRSWAKSVFLRSVKRGSAETPSPFDF